ncbi:hypothetical protein BsIDN1_38530 [Bacillus safensis]|uniref:Ribosomal RNA large subunit methyltransferase K/L-like methyltransferase domain-containing protein n=1 Tax=Bacillus safensis TaxID=561879 RepID=A0A5S9MBJ3_BACIA|nr:hypothetical protein BsIDN1_38530 [Bacillus safensis]
MPQDLTGILRLNHGNGSVKTYGTKRVWKLKKKKNYDQPLRIIASDIDHRMVDIAKMNAEEAGLSELIEFKQMQVKKLSNKRRVRCDCWKSSLW